MESALRLFKALPVPGYGYAGAPIDSDLAAMTFRNGYVFDASVTRNYKDHGGLLDLVNKVYGRNPEQMNAAFHKSFAKVATASIEQLLFEQVLHYLTTYGAEHVGLYHPESVFVPREALEVPGWEAGARMVVIRGLTKPDLKVELMKLLSSGVALSEGSVYDAVDVALQVDFTAEDIGQVKNYEVMAAMCDHLNVTPSDPVAFLRLVVYRATEKTLLINDRATVAAIAARSNQDLVKYFKQYEAAYGWGGLGSIFNRFKPLFLAMRTNTLMRQYVNRIRRVSNATHRPMTPDLLNNLTARVAAKDLPDEKQLRSALADASVFRKARLAQSLGYRATNPDSTVYRIRNGKTWIRDDLPRDPFVGSAMADMYHTVLDSIVEDVAVNVRDKTIFVPVGLNLGLPTTEKQFIGNLPAGSSFRVTEGDLICGIHWTNYGGHRVDLDLSMQNASGKIGWDGAYRTNNMWFSGDLTDAPAPHGASEVFRVSRANSGVWLMNVNYYNFGYGGENCPFKIMVGGEVESMSRHRVIDPNQMGAFASDTLDEKARALGVVVSNADELAFYFVQAKFQQMRTAAVTNASEKLRQFLISYYTHAISFNEILNHAGALMVSTPEEAEIDLSCEAITKNSLLELVRKD
jgi:hypothetical protein